MSSKSVPELLREGCTILRRDGILPTVRAGLRVLDLNYQGYWWYLRYLYRKTCRRNCQVTDPFTVIELPPDRITHHVVDRIDRWDDLGAVRDGDWDQAARPLDELIKYRSVIDHFENGTPWQETDVYREAIARVERGESYWNGSLTAADVEQRTEHVDELYETLSEEGFKSQAQRHGKPLREIVLSRTFDRSMEEVAVAIGRDGEPLFVDGNHRLAIAHVLELEQIPVHVIARHERWEAIREAVRAATNPRQLDDRITDHFPHPDLEAVL